MPVSSELNVANRGGTVKFENQINAFGVADISELVKKAEVLLKDDKAVGFSIISSFRNKYGSEELILTQYLQVPDGGMYIIALASTERSLKLTNIWKLDRDNAFVNSIGVIAQTTMAMEAKKEFRYFRFVGTISILR